MITIDGTVFNVPFKTLKRKANKLFKMAERAEDGHLEAQLIGTFYNFDLEFAQSLTNMGDYAALWDIINSAVVFHDVILPNENSGASFEAYFGDANDDIIKTVGVTNYYRNLTVSVIQRSPSEVPTP